MPPIVSSVAELHDLLGGIPGGQEDPVGIAVHEPFDDAGAVLATGVGHVAAAHQELLVGRQHLQPQRAEGIVGIDQ
jgi:hypothetical protein